MGAVLHRRLGTLVADLHVRDLEVRDDVPDGVHQARVTCRRLRSALVTFRPVLLRDVTEPIRDDLRWLALGLGDARDAEVVLERLRRLARDEVAPEDLDVVLGRIDGHLQNLELAARQRVDATMAAERYRAVLGSLDRLVAHPPWRKKASRPAEHVLSRRLHREQRRLDGFVEDAVAAHDHAAAFDDAMHAVRKAAKRLRYAWEVAEPVLGNTGARASAREVTRLLGERQDIVLTRAQLQRLEERTAAADRIASIYRQIRAGEEQRAARLADDALRLLRSGR